MKGYVILLATIMTWAVAQVVAAGPVEYVGADEQSGSSRAVVVDGRALAHTGQVLPLDKQGKVIGEGSADAQLAQVLFNLEAALAAAGSGTEHLAKATYYVSDNDSSTMLNKLRPDYYDPKRPPAASKAMVQGVGMADRSLTVDMIAVAPE